MHFLIRVICSSVLVASLLGCEERVVIDPGPDAGEVDSGVDAGLRDAGMDAGAVDAGLPYTAELSDVSILFPLPRSAAELAGDTLRPTTSALGGTLLPRARFDALGSGFLTPNTLLDWDALAVVALRIDPCFAQLEPGTGECLNQLRLTFQPLRWSGTETIAADAALHVFYSLTRPELTRLVKALIDLRRDNADGTPLGRLQPHRLMVAQGLDGPMATGVRTLVRTFAGEQRLTRLAAMDSQGSIQWTFAGVEFDAMPAAPTPMAIAGVDAGVQAFSRNFTQLYSLEGQVDPASSQPDDFSLFFSVTGARAATPPEREAAFGALLRVENPSRTTTQSVDCVSCHVATPIRVQLVATQFPELADAGIEAFAPASRWVPAAFTTSTLDDFNGFGNLHAFSYFGTGVGINQRTVNESAVVVKFLNEQVLFAPQP